MPDKQQIVLSEDQIAEIEARDWHLNGALEKRIALSPAERDALCQTVRALRADVDRFSTLADERHDLLSAERRANDDLRAERARMLQSLERAQKARNAYQAQLARATQERDALRERLAAEVAKRVNHDVERVGRSSKVSAAELEEL